MASNIYWCIYQNLEKELIDLSYQIYFDDKQLEVYSLKIAELLIRTSVEIESLAKELYFYNGGNKEDNNKLFFDKDCLRYLEEKWRLGEKKLILSNDNFHFTEKENICFTPLKDAHKKGGTEWLSSYQAIKHNRRKSMDKAKLRNLIEAVAALYILNLYYKNEDIIFNDINRLGCKEYKFNSSIFSIIVRELDSIEDDVDCIYIPCQPLYDDNLNHLYLSEYRYAIMQEEESFEKQKSFEIQKIIDRSDGAEIDSFYFETIKLPKMKKELEEKIIEIKSRYNNRFILNKKFLRTI